MMNTGVKRSQSVKCNNHQQQQQRNEQQNPQQFAVMSPNVDFLAELRNNRQFKKQEEKCRTWENRKSVSLEDLRMVMVNKETLRKQQHGNGGGSDVALNQHQTKSSMLSVLMGRGGITAAGGRNVSTFVYRMLMFCTD